MSSELWIGESYGFKWIAKHHSWHFAILNSSVKLIQNLQCLLCMSMVHVIPPAMPKYKVTHYWIASVHVSSPHVCHCSGWDKHNSVHLLAARLVNTSQAADCIQPPHAADDRILLAQWHLCGSRGWVRYPEELCSAQDPAYPLPTFPAPPNYTCFHCQHFQSTSGSLFTYITPPSTTTISTAAARSWIPMCPLTLSPELLKMAVMNHHHVWLFHVRYVFEGLHLRVRGGHWDSARVYKDLNILMTKMLMECCCNIVFCKATPLSLSLLFSGKRFI